MQLTINTLFFALTCLLTLADSRPVSQKHARLARANHKLERRCKTRSPPIPEGTAGSQHEPESVPSASVTIPATTDGSPEPTKSPKPEETGASNDGPKGGNNSSDGPKGGNDDGPKGGNDDGGDKGGNDDGPKGGNDGPKDEEPSTGGNAGGILGALFPVSEGSSAWSTSKLFSGDSKSISDSTFRPKNMIKALAPDYVSAPDGKKAMKAHFPKGSYTFGHSPQGGLSFYAPGPSEVDLSDAKEATFGYSVYFPKGFKFNKGGKLPGLYGGNSDEEAVSCSGGRRSTKCFSARLMWREDGQGEFYTYLPPYTESRFKANKKQCDYPNSDCNPEYGASIGRGQFTFPTGQWTTLSERVRLNDAGEANGELELYVNGKSEIKLTGLILRDGGAGRMRGIQMQTFFGGSGKEWASPVDQDIFFSDFSVAITKKL